MSDDVVTAEYDELKAKLGDREYRLDHLYWIINEVGDRMLFVRNEAQRQYWKNIWYCNIITKGRQLGFSTFILILMLDACLFNSNTACGIIDFTMDDATAKLAKIKYAYDNLPKYLRDAIPLTKDNTEEIHFKNGSKIACGVSHVGGTLQILHVSEFGRIAAEFPEKAREIRRGSFATVHAGQMIHIESTARGVGGHFHELVQIAEKHQNEKRPLSMLDFRLHFFAWWKHPGYRLPVNSVQITQEDDEYFAKLQAEDGIRLDLQQRCWYVATRNRIGPDDMKSEFPSTLKEAFETSIEGAFFKTQLTKARQDQRIGLALPHDPTRLVNTFWDIGEDCTAIWFHQTDGLRHRFIDYYENSGEGLEHYAVVLKEKQQLRGFNYGRHYGPHDLINKEWTAKGNKPRIEVAKELGIKFEIVPRIEHKEDAIEAARRMLGLSWFCAKYTKRGIEVLDNYRKEWDDRLATWKRTPLHNWASHGADSYQTGACGIIPEVLPDHGDRHRRKGERRTSAWSA
jgi:hypothetical protein